jgi:hypothetical protein
MTTNSNIPTYDTLVEVEGMGTKCMVRSEKKTDMVGPNGWTTPSLGPKCSILRRSVSFL